MQPEKWISLAPKTPMKPSLQAVAAATRYPNNERDNRMEYDDEAGAVGGPSSPNASGSLIRTGYTGLGNLGNTCYMNAVLQCLANCAPLKNYFLGND